MSVSRGTRLRPAPHVLCKDLGDETILLDLETETYFGLNATGSRFWSLIVESVTTEEATRILLEEYDVAPEELARDLRELVGELLERGLVRAMDA